MIFWEKITALGDSGVLVPTAVVIALWLASARRHRLALHWCLTAGSVGVGVALSKLLFMGWCLGVPTLDFTGISGHTALAAVTLPTLVYLIWQMIGQRAGRGAWWIGAMLAVLIGVSRLAIHVHSVSEVVAGLLLGLASARLFLHATSGAVPIPIAPRLALLSAVLLPVLLWLQPAPTQFLLERIAVLISRQHVAFTRETEACDQPNQQIGDRAGRGDAFNIESRRRMPTRTRML